MYVLNRAFCSVDDTSVMPLGIFNNLDDAKKFAHENLKLIAKQDCDDDYPANSWSYGNFEDTQKDQAGKIIDSKLNIYSDEDLGAYSSGLYAKYEITLTKVRD